MVKCHYCEYWFNPDPLYNDYVEAEEIDAVTGIVIMTPIWICIICTEFDNNQEA